MQLDLCSFQAKTATWIQGDEQTITWDVASTDAAPVNV
jgi:hypothetical protein